jgi:O-6-methylguanine DNA methyltransferase
MSECYLSCSGPRHLKFALVWSYENNTLSIKHLFLGLHLINTSLVTALYPDVLIMPGMEADDVITSINHYLKGESNSISKEFLCNETFHPLSADILTYLEKHIKEGKPATYEAIAEGFGTDLPTVINVLATNPFPLFYPCHRIIHQNGDIGSYVAGVEYKQALLDLEKQ